MFIALDFERSTMDYKYDYLIVGSGLFGSIFAYEASRRGCRCLVIDKRSHIGGNIYTEEIEGIQVHKYGPHIFHTDDNDIWNYINQFATFNRFTNSPIARYKDETYNLPFNMNTFNKLWGVTTPDEAKEAINKQIQEANITQITNLEEQAISLVGRDIYEKLVKGYTEKQWGQKTTELPSFIIKRLPVRFTYDNNYFNSRYQGIPDGGYTQIIEKMLENCDILLNADFHSDREKFRSMAKKIVYTGMIDEYFDYCLGELSYRSLRFDTEIIDKENVQGNAVVNYCEYDIPYTRIIEHKHFEFGKQPKSVVTKEYPSTWQRGDEPYYPINNDINNALYQQYKELADKESDILFGGRLGEYRYYDMNHVIEVALHAVKKEFGLLDHENR